MKVDIKIQSISDIITNSSTEVFTVYRTSDKRAIKDLVNAILAVNGSCRFDDLFELHMEIDGYAADLIYDHYDGVSEQFETVHDFIKYLETLSDKELVKYEDMLCDLYDYSPKPLYCGVYATLKDGVTETNELKQAIRAITNINYIFEHDYGDC